MLHRNAPLSAEGRHRLVQRCRTRPISHVAAEMGISRACASKWVNRYRKFGDLGLEDRSSAPHHQPTATDARVIAQIERARWEKKWSANRITFELDNTGIDISRRTVTRHLAHLGLNRRKFIDATGANNRTPRRIRTWTSEQQRSQAVGVWNVHYNYHRPHTATGNQPPASRLHTGVTNVMASYI